MLFSRFHQGKGSTGLLDWRIGAFFLGAALGLAGILLNISWLVTTALIVLLGGIVLRGLARRDSQSGEQEPGLHE